MASERSFTRADEDAASVDGQSMVDVDSSKFIKVVSNREIDIRGEQKTVYECRRCGNRYGRIDHIKRHYRSRRCDLSVQRTVAYQDQMRMDALFVALNVRRASIESECLRIEGVNRTGALIFHTEISWNAIEQSTARAVHRLEISPRGRVELLRLAGSAFRRRPNVRMSDLVGDVDIEVRYAMAR